MVVSVCRIELTDRDMKKEYPRLSHLVDSRHGVGILLHGPPRAVLDLQPAARRGPDAPQDARRIVAEGLSWVLHRPEDPLFQVLECGRKENLPDHFGNVIL